MISQRQGTETDGRENGTTGALSSITVRIVSAVAEREGVDPMALDTPIYEAIDSDALTTITEADPETELTLSFNYAGYRVTVIVDEEPVVQVTEL